MSLEEGTDAKSYFWICLTLSEDCPFLSSGDPHLTYFGIGMSIIYGALFLIIISDWLFFWSLDSLHHQADQYINKVKTKIRKVQVDQRRLMSTQERTEKQLKRSKDSMKIVTALRGALDTDDSSRLDSLTSSVVHQRTEANDNWSEITCAIDF